MNITFKELIFAGNSNSFTSSILTCLVEILTIVTKFLFKICFNVIKLTCCTIFRIIKSSLNRLFAMAILLRLVLIDIYNENINEKEVLQPKEENQNLKIEISKKFKKKSKIIYIFTFNLICIGFKYFFYFIVQIMQKQKWNWKY